MRGLDTILTEAKRESLGEILNEPIDIRADIEKLPSGDFILRIVEKHVNLDGPIDGNAIAKVKNYVENFFGIYSAERVATIFKYPMMQSELSKLLDEDFSKVDALKSTKYVSFLLNATEEYLNREGWRKTDSLLWAAEELVKNITGKKRLPLEAEINLNYALYKWKVGDYFGSIKKARDSLKVARKIKDKKLIARNYHLFGVLYGDFLDDKKPAVWFDEECLRMIKDNTDNSSKRLKASLYNNLGVAYHKMADMDEEKREEYLRKAAESYEKGINICGDIGYKKMEGWLYFNLGEVYAYLHEFDNAETASIEARKIFDELDDPRGVSGVLMCDAVIEGEKGNPKEALEYINKSLEIRESSGEPRRVADALVFRGQLYQKLGDTEDAKHDFEIALSIYDKIGSREAEKIRNYLTK